jgi:antitoxin Phd
MTAVSEHAIEMPTGQPELDRVADAARSGEVIYLTRGGERVAAVVSVDAAEAMERSEDEADVWAAREALADPEPSIPLEQVLAENADVLASYPDEER